MSRILGLELPPQFEPEDFKRLLNERFRAIDSELAKTAKSVIQTIQQINAATPTTTTATTSMVYVGDHAERLATDPTAYPVGAVWYELDRSVFYQIHQISGGAQLWFYIGGILSVAWANRPSDLALNAAYGPDNNFRIEVFDRSNVQYTWGGNDWYYASGEIHGVASSIPAAILLTAADDGLLYRETQYKHRYVFNYFALPSPTWEWADGDVSGRIEAFLADPGAGWHICDGSAGVIHSTSNGSTATVTLPNLTGATFLKGVALASVSAAVQSPVAPTITASSGTPSAATTAAGGVGATVATNAHTHAITASAGTDGIPQHVKVAFYYRL